MGDWVKALADQLYNLSLIPTTFIVEGENRLPPIISWLPKMFQPWNAHNLAHPYIKEMQLKTKIKRKVGNWECLIASGLLGQWFHIKFLSSLKCFQGSLGVMFTFSSGLMNMCSDQGGLHCQTAFKGLFIEFISVESFNFQLLSNLSLQNQKKLNLLALLSHFEINGCPK